MNSIRVVIADESATFRQSLRRFLEPEAALTIVAEASNASDVPVVAQQVKPDVVLIDFVFFCSLQARLETLPAFKTLVTVPIFERADIIKAFLHDARAVVAKTSPSHVWCESIRTVGAGQYWLANESIAILIQALQEHFPQQTELRSRNDYRLTPREVEIIEKIARGHSNKQVGQAFSICEKTVKHHLTSIFSKVGVSSRLELALFALSHRLLESSSHPPAILSDRDNLDLT